MARVAVATGLRSSGALSLLWRNVLGSRGVCVLGLHRVLSRSEQSQTNSHPAMVIRETTFGKLLEYLQGRFQVIGLDAFLKDLSDAGETKPACLITFDDGWQDTYNTAFPLLRAFRMPAIVFLATGMVNTAGGFWMERLRKRAQSRSPARVEPREEVAVETLVERLKRMPAKERNKQLQRWLPVNLPKDCAVETDAMLTWEQVKEMSQGGVEIGAHTVSHTLLSYENDAEIESELTVCKLSIEEKLAKPVRAFAYPNGDWDGRTREWVRRTGYDCAFTTQPGWFRPGQDILSVRRILLCEGNLTGLDGKFSPAMADLTLTGWR